MSASVGLPIGLVLVHNGRSIRLDEDLGDWMFRFTDVESGSDYVVWSETTQQPIKITFQWLLDEKEAGRLVDPDENSTMDGRRRSFMGLDKSACAKRDPKSAWRFRWAWAALNDGPATTSDDSFRDWIATRPDLLVSENGKAEAVPIPSSLRRWVRKLKAGGGSRGVLVSCAGRLEGQTQLPGLEDWLVHEAAIFTWAAEDAKVVDGGSYYLMCRQDIQAGTNEELKARLGPQEVRLETIRKRIRKLENKVTTEAKLGARRAKRLFKITGESVPTERFLERVYMDGTELRQYVTFSEEWPIPSAKMKLVNLIDDYTHYWFLPAAFCGPYRDDQSIVALTNMMAPPVDLTPEDLAENPWRGEAWGTPDLIVPDNDQTLISPGMLPALGELGPTLELPETYHPDGKALVESLNKFIKGWMEGVAGTVRGPRHPKDPTRNAVNEAELTRADMRREIISCNRAWNEWGRSYFGELSPLQMVEQCILGEDPPKQNPRSQVRRALSKTHDDVIMTRSGIEFDGIIYKSDEFADVLSGNYRHTGFKDRIDGSSKIRVSIRTFEGDINAIEVFDEQRRTYVVGLSTEPEYTAGLSRWEHTQFKNMMAVQRPARERELSRLQKKVDSLRRATVSMPKQSLRVRNNITALLESDEVRRASGRRVHSADFGNEIGAGILAASAEKHRTDLPRPVHVPGAARKPKDPAPPDALLTDLGGDGADKGTRDTDSDEFVWPDLVEEDDEEEDE